MSTGELKTTTAIKEKEETTVSFEISILTFQVLLHQSIQLLETWGDEDA